MPQKPFPCVNRVVDSNFKVVEKAGFPVESRWIHFYYLTDTHGLRLHHPASSRTVSFACSNKRQKGALHAGSVRLHLFSVIFSGVPAT